MTTSPISADEFIAEFYGSQYSPTSDLIAEKVAEAIDYVEWEGAAAATEAYFDGQADGATDAIMGAVNSVPGLIAVVF